MKILKLYLYLYFDKSERKPLNLELDFFARVCYNGDVGGL